MSLWLHASSRKMMLFWNNLCSKQGFVLLTTSVLAPVTFQKDAHFGKKILFYSVKPSLSMIGAGKFIKYSTLVVE